MTVPTTPVTSYSDITSDTSLFNSPLLNKNGTFDGQLTGDTATSVGPDGYDYFVIDIAGGTHDSTGSISIAEGTVLYSNLNSGFGDNSVETVHRPLSGTGTLTIPASHWTGFSG